MCGLSCVCLSFYSCVFLFILLPLLPLSFRLSPCRQSAASGSALDWVQRSRTMAVPAAQAAPKRPAATAVDYEGAALAGLKVRHTAAAIHTGEEVVMTLKDDFIIGKDGDVNEDEDELENIHLKEDETTARNNAVRAWHRVSV